MTSLRYSKLFNFFIEKTRLVHENRIPMGNPWEMFHGMGWDGTARIAFPMNDNKCQN